MTQDEQTLPDHLLVPLRTLGRHVQTLQDKPWSVWTATAPILPRIEDQVELLPLELACLKSLGHLEEVCHHPRDQVKRSEERIAVGRAHRVPSRSLETLAAHPEDWLRRTLRGVAPKRILALVSEEDLNLYENRVAVRLCDHLLMYLKRRLRQLDAIEQLMENADELSGLQGTHWGTRERACQLLGDLFSDHQGRKALDRTRSTLQELERRLLGLQDTRLYRAIPRQAGVGLELKHTNILVNDGHYRAVAALWRTWVRFGLLTRGRQTLLEDLRHWRRFCLLTLVRALELHRWTPADMSVRLSGRGEGIPFKGPLGPLVLRVPDDANEGGPETEFILEQEGLVPLRLTLQETGTKLGPFDLVLTPRRLQDRQRVWCSPLELFGVERVMGGIQRWLLTQRYEAYPIRIEIPEALRRAPQEGLERIRKEPWLKVRGSSKDWVLELIDVPRSKQGLETYEQAIEAFRKAIDTLLNELKGHELPQAGRRDRAREVPWKDLGPSLERGGERLVALLLCPVCPSSRLAKLEPREGDFVCRCGSCKSRWEVRVCKNCNKRLAIIAKEAPSDGANESGRDWPDKDGLALRDPQDTQHWICRHCCG